jgi:chaperonin GroEL
MAVDVVNGDHARLRMVRGLDLLAQAARLTLGPAGPTVLIEHRTSGIAPIVTRDGATVANSISMEDPVADLGARILRDVANGVSREAGDGTTGAIVLAHCMAKAALRSITAGAEPMQIKKGMDMACAAAIDDLTSRAADGSAEATIVSIAGIASREEGVGLLLAKAVARLGKGCTLNLELGEGREDEFQVIEGLRYAQGFLSPYFVTDKARQIAELDHPYILLYDGEIDQIDQLIPVFDAVREADRSLLIVAENLTDGALTTTLLNHVRGIIKVVAVKPPAYGDRRIQRLGDLAVLTGGSALLTAHGHKPEHAALKDLGQARRVVVDAQSTTIVGGAGDPAAIARHIAGLQLELARVKAKKPGDGSPRGNLQEIDDLDERIASMRSAIGVIKVGGSIDIEIKERLKRIENAWNSVSAAHEEGVLPGGGAALLRARRALESVVGANYDQTLGIAVVHEALAAPLRQIAINSGLNADEVIGRVWNHDSDFIAFDANSRCYGDAFEMGILDPVKVVRLALKNAVGVVGMMMTSGPVITAIRDTAARDGYDPEWAAATREDPRIQ